MNRTRIEYGTHHWPIFTGCLQPHSVCATRDKCWARGLPKRFAGLTKGTKGWGDLYNPDFSPKFNSQLLSAPLQLRKPARILVAFTGDMFGPGNNPFQIAQVLNEVRAASRHQFLFLTKSPENLAQFNPWPSNAWVGCSLTGAETYEVQREKLQNLLNTDAKVRWISYEPILGKCELNRSLEGIDWLVVGAQSGPGAIKPNLDNVLDILEAADKARVYLWLKNNLLDIYPELPRQQELPTQKEDRGAMGNAMNCPSCHKAIPIRVSEHLECPACGLVVPDDQ